MTARFLNLLTLITLFSAPLATAAGVSTADLCSASPSAKATVKRTMKLLSESTVGDLRNYIDSAEPAVCRPNLAILGATPGAQTSHFIPGQVCGASLIVKSASEMTEIATYLVAKKATGNICLSVGAFSSH